jgi:hypothetical protein
MLHDHHVPSPKISLSKGGRTVTVRIPVQLRHRAGGKQIPWSPAPRVGHSLLKAVVRAHHWREMLENGEYASAAELAKAEKVNDSYVSRILRLSLLAPDIVEAIAMGQQPRSDLMICSSRCRRCGHDNIPSFSAPGSGPDNFLAAILSPARPGGCWLDAPPSQPRPRGVCPEWSRDIANVPKERDVQDGVDVGKRQL